MPRFKVFPAGFDPMIEAGPFTAGLARMGIEPWTAADTERMRALAAQAIESDERPPHGRWHMELTDD